MTIAGSNISGIYKELCTRLENDGETVEARGLITREIINVQLQLDNPYARFVNIPARDMDMRYCIGELCFFLSGSTDLEKIAHYSKFWRGISDDGISVNSAYGNRLFHRINYSEITQYDYVVSELKRDQASRKAVMLIYMPNDAHISKDNPCTMFLQFLIRNKRLHCITSMRSNDVWLGVPYDVAFFTLLQEMVLIELQRNDIDVRMGNYFHNVGSMHMYERNYDGVHNVSHDQVPTPMLAPQLSAFDLSTWFKTLLRNEQAKRTNTPEQVTAGTPFQAWCSKWL